MDYICVVQVIRCMLVWYRKSTLKIHVSVLFYTRCFCRFCHSDPSLGLHYWIWTHLFIHSVHDHDGPVSCMAIEWPTHDTCRDTFRGAKDRIYVQPAKCYVHSVELLCLPVQQTDGMCSKR